MLTWYASVKPVQSGVEPSMRVIVGCAGSGPVLVPAVALIRTDDIKHDLPDRVLESRDWNICELLEGFFVEVELSGQRRRRCG